MQHTVLLHTVQQWNIWNIYTMEYYFTIKRNGVLIHATTWMTLKYMLSERSQTQKTTCYMIPFI